MRNQLTYSRLEEHNRDQPTDSLYDPLRAILTHPERVSTHQNYMNNAVRSSRVTNDFRYLRTNQAHELKQHTLIPIDKPLRATHNYEKVQGTKFVALDAEQKVLGPAISPQEMQYIRRQGLREQKIVYDFDKDPQPQIIVEPKKTKYRSPPIQQYKAKDNYKYNLYSMIDEPANKIKQFGCGACSCPGNQIIASRNEPQSLNWLK